jgi:hypothetical protein
MIVISPSMDFEWASMRKGRMAAVALAIIASGRLRVMK